MWDISLLYIGVVVLIVAAGFVFALRMGISSALEADHQWSVSEPATAQPVTVEPGVAGPVRRSA